MIRELLQSKVVGIAGAGGLGSNCAVALARAGVGRLVVADFDTVSLLNLDRQYYFRDQVGQPKVAALAANIARIDPAVAVEGHLLRLDPPAVVRLFAGCHAIVEAFDDAAAKRMIAETAAEELPGIPLVMGSGLAGYGRNDALRTKRLGMLYVCGDEESAVGEGAPPLAPRVGIVANMQANLVLELLLGPRPEGGRP